MSSRECLECGVSISSQSRTGRCRKCAGRATGRANGVQHPRCRGCGATTPRSDSRYCSWDCYVANCTRPRGEDHHAWKGDEVGEWGARRRAQKELPPGECEVCGDPADRHHVDRDILNNDPSNIRYLCRSHHIQLHRREQRASLLG